MVSERGNWRVNQHEDRLSESLATFDFFLGNERVTAERVMTEMAAAAAVAMAFLFRSFIGAAFQDLKRRRWLQRKAWNQYRTSSDFDRVDRIRRMTVLRFQFWMLHMRSRLRKYLKF